MNKHGQSIVEYALIAILVITGIVFMGPYVLRSIDAHFKLWDDGVRDSFKEPLTQAPINDLPNIDAECTCTPMDTHFCGGSAAGSKCPVGQSEVDYSCNRTGCNGNPLGYFCKNDPSCCKLTRAGCGTTPLPTGNIPTTSCTSGTPSGSTCVQPPDSDPTNCYFGYQVYSSTCNSSPNVCVLDHNDCALPQCQGFNSASSTLCPGAQNNLTQNTAVTYVTDASACSNPVTPCQAYCNAGYAPNNTNPPTACTPITGLGCSITPSNAPPNVTVISFKGAPDCTKENCPAGDVLVGYCLTNTSDKPFAEECSSSNNSGGQCPRVPTETSISLFEGDHCTQDTVAGYLYCVPCNCANGCAYLAPPSATQRFIYQNGHACNKPDDNTNGVGGYYGLPSVQTTCCAPGTVNTTSCQVAGSGKSCV